MKQAIPRIAIGLGVLLVVVLVSMLRAAPQDQDRTNQDRQTVWEYGRLVIGEEDYIWQGGESNLEPEVLSLENLHRRIGGRSQPTFTNLLNQIGKSGWELVTIEDTIYTFKRGR